MKVSVIVTTYKDSQTLSLVLDALLLQDYKNFEVIVAEDDDSQETAELVKKYQKLLDIKHIFHPDTGRTKPSIQNKAIVASKGEYLIFIDGDVLVHSKFISSQVYMARTKQVLAGRRVNLDIQTSKKIRDGRLRVNTLQKFYFLFALKFMFNKDVRFEQGFYINPNSWLYKYFFAKRKRSVAILGCNWSCFKEDFIAINGFDEGYVNSSIADDTDLDWRFKMASLEVLSSKNIAVVYHLYHAKSDALGGENGREQMKERQKKKLYICEKGIERDV